MSILTVRPRRSRLRTAAVALATVALLALGATVALAHDPLASTNPYVPANDSVVSGALPATILVNFQDTFRQAGDVANPSVPVAHVRDSSGVDHVANAVQNPNNAKQLVITTKDRTVPGKYTVIWTITASDGHAVSNDGGDVSEEGSPLIFTVRATTAAAKAATSTSTSTSTTVIAAAVGVILVILIGAGAVLFWFRRRRDNMSRESDS